MNLTIDAVSKKYKGGNWGLREFSLELGTGTLGLLGPNGAGKSTLMRILATITKPTSGSASWNGRDIARYPNDVRVALGYLPQDFGVYPNLSAREFLEYLSSAKGMPRRKAETEITSLLDAVNLTEVSRRPLKSYSGGMRQRVGIAQALLNDPRLLIVDEPTAGLDPEERVRFRNLLSDLAGERIIILSTHVVSDVESIADKIAIINRGCLLALASPEQLLAEARGSTWEFMLPSAELEEKRGQWLITSLARKPEGVRLRVVSASAPYAGARVVAPTLEDAYLRALAEHRQREAA